MNATTTDLNAIAITEFPIQQDRFESCKKPEFYDKNDKKLH